MAALNQDEFEFEKGKDVMNRFITKLSTAFFVLQFGLGSTLAQTGGPYKVAAADVTGDGIVDLVLSYDAIGVISVEQGDGQGEFKSLAINDLNDRIFPRNAQNLCLADVDSDGLLDLVTGISSNPPEFRDTELTEEQLAPKWKGDVVVARNAGSGRFEPKTTYTVPSESKGVALVDLDNDGQLDLMYIARGSGYKGDLQRGRLFVRQGLGDFQFGSALECDAGPSAYYVETADLDNDGYLDILVPAAHSDTVHYVMSSGQSVLAAGTAIKAKLLRASPIPGYRGHGINDVRAADFNNDGNLDLVTANLGTNCISIFPGNGNGTFQIDKLLDAGEYGAFLAVGDLDNDGDTDFVITHWTKRKATSVFLNRGGAEFFPRKEYTTGLGNYGVALADVNGDGNLDIVTANYQARSYSLLIGIGDGTFESAITKPAGLRLRDGQWVAEK